MSKLTDQLEDMDHLKTRGSLPPNNSGLPSLNLDECNKSSLPSDWEIAGVFGDILMCEYIDENLNGEILRDGIYLKRDITQNLWRVVKVLKVGPSSSERIKEGDMLLIPGDRGIPGITKQGKRLIFVNEPRVFARVLPVKGTTEE